MLELSPTLTKLLSLLSDGAWHSGEALGEVLGVSRAAVAKQLKLLPSLGLSVESVKGTGYRLRQVLDLYDEASLSSLIPAELTEKLGEIHLHKTIDSTNNFLMQRLRGGNRIHAEICLAEMQHSGRGRRGRVWYSPYGQNMYFSIAWHFEQGVSAIEGLSLAVGVAVCRALENLGVVGASLKWPNDILFNKKKLGGVLVELGGDAVSDCVAIVGVGLNVNMLSTAGAGVDQPWTSLKQLGFEVSRNALAVAMIIELTALLEGYTLAGFVQYQAAWNELNAFDGDKVTLESATFKAYGYMLGVDASGALRLSLEDGSEQTFIGGELSLRGACDPVG